MSLEWQSYANLQQLLRRVLQGNSIAMIPGTRVYDNRGHIPPTDGVLAVRNLRRAEKAGTTKHAVLQGVHEQLLNLYRAQQKASIFCFLQQGAIGASSPTLLIS